MFREGSWKMSWAVAVLFASLWLVPPIIHQMMHQCPVIHPDSIQSAAAVPAFARKYGVSCSQCHVAFPTLNSFGRQFKLNGYVMAPGGTDGTIQSPDGAYWSEKLFPLGVIVRSRPYDKFNSDHEFKMQAISDVDLFVAGGDAAKHVSYFGEVDANANTTPSFQPAMGDIQLGYHPYSFFNILAARRGFFVMDPYQNLSNFGSPTLANRAIAGLQQDQQSLSGDTMDETKQTVSMYGYAPVSRFGSIYYAAGATADKNDDAGAGNKDGNVRLAFDTLRGLEIGTFGSFGNEGPSATAANAVPLSVGDKAKYAKTGVDTMLELGNLVGRGAFLFTHDKDLASGVAETNRAAYAELMYIFGHHEIPFLVPLVRENWYETTNGTSQFNYVTVQLAHYFMSNMKAFVEYSADTKQDLTSTSGGVAAPKESRWTTQIEVGF